MSRKRSNWLTFLAVVGTLASAAFLASAAAVAQDTLMGPNAEPPLAASPGGVGTGAVIESRCPTFSWGQVKGARHYELVVYRLGEGNEEALPVLLQRFAGSVHGWTPSLDSCLERGGQYAWSVRSVGRETASEWSIPSLFEVAPGPSEAEFEAALEVVREYLDGRTNGSPGVSAAGAEESSGGTPATLIPGPAGGVTPGPSPLGFAGGDSDLQVNGSPVVTVATLTGPTVVVRESATSSGLRMVSCMAGERVVGGGAVTTPPAALSINGPIETSGTPSGWRAQADDNAPTNALVLCASP